MTEQLLPEPGQRWWVPPLPEVDTDGVVVLKERRRWDGGVGWGWDVTDELGGGWISEDYLLEEGHPVE